MHQFLQSCRMPLRLVYFDLSQDHSRRYTYSTALLNRCFESWFLSFIKFFILNGSIVLIIFTIPLQRVLWYVYIFLNDLVIHQNIQDAKAFYKIVKTDAYGCVQPFKTHHNGCVSLLIRNSCNLWITSDSLVNH